MLIEFEENFIDPSKIVLITKIFTYRFRPENYYYFKYYIDSLEKESNYYTDFKEVKKSHETLINLVNNTPQRNF